jgi:preprotein translocase subunit SecD
MHTRPTSSLAVLVAIAMLLAGCTSTAPDHTSSRGSSLQLRLATSSVEGKCSVPAPTSKSPASACDRTGTTTYKLGESLGVITPTSVDVPKDQGSPQSVVLNFNKADTRTLDAVSRKAMGKSLAILLDGRVLSAPIVEEPITTSQLTIAFATSSEAKQVASELGASSSS